MAESLKSKSLCACLKSCSTDVFEVAKQSLKQLNLFGYLEILIWALKTPYLGTSFYSFQIRFWQSDIRLFLPHRNIDYLASILKL